MVKQTNLNLALISFGCAFGVSLGALVLLHLAMANPIGYAPLFVLGAVVLSFVFYRVADIKLVMVYSLMALGLLFLLFPMFMYLGIPRALPDRPIEITVQQAVLISAATGAAALVLAVALMKAQFKGR
ncbi:hypothetical protein COY95_00090 [Candidatus Woesearchaeota archaeon CG_4_10_14_0_8_um_filter_47_5]|nr:MAG: hypothetical protein COY95_00090 [Candidatus Woesearchaeota archaeon CG_4_10_14_0_8_um_filter_47_5]